MKKNYVEKLGSVFLQCQFSLLFSLLLIVINGCSSSSLYHINIMPAPDIYHSANIDPFSDEAAASSSHDRGMLYVTDRVPDPNEKKYSRYLNERGDVLRAGIATIGLGDGTIDWQEARKISLLKNRPDYYPLKVTAAEEFGVLDFSINTFTQTEFIPSPVSAPAAHFAELIDAKLAVSEKKDIYIYVHGYKVVFENPILVASELWHFLGYDGVFIAYAWPSTPSRWAYFSDLESADLSSSNLRQMLKFLAEETSVERIHIIGYSAGTRVVGKALWQLALQYAAKPDSELDKLRLGNVILVGSDIDQHIFARQIADGLLRVADRVTVYLSANDKALSFSSWLFSRDRLGEAWKKSTPKRETIEFLRKSKKLTLINVTGAEGSTTGNGHAYFRQSPWVSSDILISLFYDLAPEARGLVYDNDYPAWFFPEDYLMRLKNSLSLNLNRSQF